MPIPNGDLATTNFAFGAPDNQYIYFEWATSGAFWKFKAPYLGLIDDRQFSGPDAGYLPFGIPVGIGSAGGKLTLT